MKEIILYYSFTGNTKKYAKKLAKKIGSDIYEITEIRKRSKMNAFIYGCFQALTDRKSKIHPVTVNLNDYEKIIIASPVWAGSPVPAINNIFDILPKGKIVDVVFVSENGVSNYDKIKEKIKNKKCKVGEIKNIKV